MMKEPEEEENLGKKRKVKMRMGKKWWKGKENGRQKIEAEKDEAGRKGRERREMEDLKKEKEEETDVREREGKG